jgi:hypothetical protein
MSQYLLTSLQTWNRAAAHLMLFVISEVSSGQGEVIHQDKGTEFVHYASTLAAAFKYGLQT